MKLNMFVGSLVLGAGLCGQSSAGGLLDRMLGLRGQGCDTVCCDIKADPGCGAEAACDPCAGAGPGCGIESPCGLFGRGRGCDPGCGLEAACDPCAGAAGPGCGIASACDPCAGLGVKASRRTPLLDLLRSGHSRLTSHGCDNGCTGCGPSCGIADPGCGIADPGCGIAGPGCGLAGDACDPCAGLGGVRRPGLLASLFRKKAGCDSFDPCCGVAAPGCCNGAPAPQAAPADVEVPTPVVDPSAYLSSKRRVIQASAQLR